MATLAAMSMVAMLSALDQTVVSTALPHILTSLPGATLLGWIFTAYFVGATATVAVVGKLTDLFGRRQVFLTSIGLFSLASLACGIATSLPELVAFRGLQGIGAGAIQTCGLIVMADMFPPRDRARWQVINSIGFATASAIGPSVGGFLADNFSWRWIFLLNVPLCIATVGALLYGLQSTSRAKTRPRIDWPGATLSTFVVIDVLLVCTWGGREFAWTSVQIIGLVGAGLIAAFLLVRAERGAEDPVISVALVSGGSRAWSMLASTANSMVWFGLILLVPLRLQLVLGASATEAGALLTPGIVLGPLTSVAAGQLMARTGHFRFTSIAAGVLQFAGTGLLLLLPPNADRALILCGYLLATAGNGCGGPTFMIAYQNALGRDQLGAGTGLFSLSRQFGASVSTALAGAIVGAGVSEAGIGSAAGEVVQQAFVLPLIGGIAVLTSAILLPKLPLRTTHHEVVATATEGTPVAVG
ncbi:MAG: MFS transporter [Chloroflexi bacterium]|nr:MFS transporter [Chloroflexota bacterium]